MLRQNLRLRNLGYLQRRLASSTPNSPVRPRSSVLQSFLPRAATVVKLPELPTYKDFEREAQNHNVDPTNLRKYSRCASNAWKEFSNSERNARTLTNVSIQHLGPVDIVYETAIFLWQYLNPPTGPRMGTLCMEMLYAASCAGSHEATLTMFRVLMNSPHLVELIARYPRLQSNLELALLVDKFPDALYIQAKILVEYAEFPAQPKFTLAHANKAKLLLDKALNQGGAPFAWRCSAALLLSRILRAEGDYETSNYWIDVAANAWNYVDAKIALSVLKNHKNIDEQSKQLQYARMFQGDATVYHDLATEASQEAYKKSKSGNKRELNDCIFEANEWNRMASYERQ